MPSDQFAFRPFQFFKIRARQIGNKVEILPLMFANEQERDETAEIQQVRGGWRVTV